MKYIEKILILLLIIMIFYLIFEKVSGLDFNKQLEGTDPDSIITETNKNPVNSNLNSIINFRNTTEDILILQTLLIKILKINLKRTGKFDNNTRHALILFQKQKALKPSGDLDFETRRELCKYIHLLQDE